LPISGHISTELYGGADFGKVPTMRNPIVPAATLAAVLIASLATGAAAATARASDPLDVYAGPGHGYRIIGKLARNAVVTLSECTPSGNWCRIKTGGPVGWVLGTYLVGSAAKVMATPPRSLVEPFLFRHGR